MLDSANVPTSELQDPRSARRYSELIEQSRDARRQGDHWAAQQFATAAHQWAMDERIRLKRLSHARGRLAVVTKQLEAAWDKDRDCATIEELRAQHPEFKRVITVWEEASERVRSLHELLEDTSDETE